MILLHLLKGDVTLYIGTFLCYLPFHLLLRYKKFHFKNNKQIWNQINFALKFHKLFTCFDTDD